MKKHGYGEQDSARGCTPPGGRWAVWRKRPAQRANERVSFDDITRVNAMRNLNGKWGCWLLRHLAYRLYRYGD